MVLEGRAHAHAAGTGERFLREARIEIIPVAEAHVSRALEGWRRFGKGRHPAGLNFGDCFTYALAATTGHPILCTGDDFARTDAGVVTY
jgi:ribonuclease VapC